MYTPSAHVEITLKSNQTTLKTAHITWRFSDEFIQNIIPQYDKNKNGIFDKKELDTIEKHMLTISSP